MGGLDAELLLGSDFGVAGERLFDVRVMSTDIISGGKGAIKLLCQLLTILACCAKIELRLILSRTCIGLL